MSFDPITYALSKKNGGSGGGGAPADWNAKEGEAGYVKNRTHYEEPVVVEYLPKTTRRMPSSGGLPLPKVGPLIEGIEYIVTFNGAESRFVAAMSTNPDKPRVFIGNGSLLELGDDTGENYVVTYDNDSGSLGLFTSVSSITISIMKVDKVVRHLDPKYIKDMYYEEEGEPVQVLSETKVVIDGGRGYVENALPLIGDETYVVSWNGTEFECVGLDLGGEYCIGDVYTASGGEVGTESTGEPFAIVCANGGVMIMPLDGSTEVTLSIVSRPTTVHKIDKKYLPTISDNSDIFERGIVSKDTIMRVVRGNPFYPEVGVTTYLELRQIRDSSVLYDVTIGNSNYTGLSMSVFGSSTSNGNFVGHCNIRALDSYCRGCVIKMELDGHDDDSVVTSIDVNYAEIEN